MNILSVYEHIRGILLVILIDVGTAASVQSLLCFLCVEIEFYEKGHLRSVIDTYRHTQVCTCSAFWQGYHFFLHSVQKHANQISVFLQILLDSSGCFTI